MHLQAVGVSQNRLQGEESAKFLSEESARSVREWAPPAAILAPGAAFCIAKGSQVSRGLNNFQKKS